jgi:hypothetical protein
MIINRYLSAILSTVIVLLTSFVAIPSYSWTLGNPQVAAFVALAASTVVSYFVPIVSGAWPGVLKTGVGILAAIFAAVWPLLAGGQIDWLIVVLAGLNALAQEVGVNVRVDDPALTSSKAETGKTATGVIPSLPQSWATLPTVTPEPSNSSGVPPAVETPAQS